MFRSCIDKLCNGFDIGIEGRSFLLVFGRKPVGSMSICLLVFGSFVAMVEVVTEVLLNGSYWGR